MLDQAGLVVCPLCRGSVVGAGSKRRWRLAHCPRCDHYAVLPCPTEAELQAIYSSTAGYGVGREVSLAGTDGRPAARLDAALLSFGVKRKAFLDVGCGDGRLLFHMRNLGWEVAGTDYSDVYVEKCRAHGLDVRQGDLGGAALSRDWSVAYLGDVVEHLRNPLETMCEVIAHLAPGGIVVVRTPNAASGFSKLSCWLNRVTRTEWLASEAPLHINDFTPRSLRTLFLAVGLSVLTETTEGRRPFWYTVGASGMLDREKLRLKQCRSKADRFGVVLKALPKVLTAAAWTMPSFAVGRMADYSVGGADYIVMYGAKRDAREDTSAPRVGRLVPDAGAGHGTVRAEERPSLQRTGEPTLLAASAADQS